MRPSSPPMDAWVRPRSRRRSMLDEGSAHKINGSSVGLAPTGGTVGPALPLPGQGARDPAGTIWHAGAFRSDPWAHAGEPLPDRPVIVSRQRWLAERTLLMARKAPL